MALEAPVQSSSGELHFPFTSYNAMSRQQDPEARSPFKTLSSPAPTTDSGSLRPDSIKRISSNSMNVLSPSDIVGPSPVTSNGTETTEIEDDASEDVQNADESDLSASQSEVLMLTTNLPETVRQAGQEEAVSVIHAPESFTSWTSTEPTLQHLDSQQTSPRNDDGSLSTVNGNPSVNSDQRTVPVLSTDIKPVRYSLDNATPQAQDLKEMLRDDSRLRSSSTSSLEKIEEQTEAEGDEGEESHDDNNLYPYLNPDRNGEDEIVALRRLLRNTWRVCNNLVEVSELHRTKVFRGPATPDPHERAWRSCWKLCHRLYSMHSKGIDSLNAGENLVLCRDFCSALFDARRKNDKSADSVLRVSFELNNHLYSAIDPDILPEEFRERTLEFYLALCHRIMRQKYDERPLPLAETDELLVACWAFAENLISLRHNRRYGDPDDEAELLTFTYEACSDLSNVFHTIFSKRRSSRNTPRANQTSFFSPSPMVDATGRESRSSNRSSLRSGKGSVKSTQKEERPRKPPPVPETPVTEFEDTPISPESRSPQMPNIMVLGPSSDGGRGTRWSSNASNMSSYSHNSNRTSSTATTTTATEDANVSRCKALVLRAAMNIGFNKDSITDSKTGAHAFQKFVQGLQTGAFGSLPTHATLLQQYRDSVLKDGFMPRSHSVSSRSGKRISAQDMAKSVQSMMGTSSRFSYLRELFKFVFQFPLEEVDSRRNVSIHV